MNMYQVGSMARRLPTVATLGTRMQSSMSAAVQRQGLLQRAGTASSQRLFHGPSHKHLKVEEVQSLFHLWNDALATLDPLTVSKRYTSRPYLLPTISNIPRTDPASIIDYFETFLKLKPQGVVTESFVTTGELWCSDCGLYEFTMGADGSKVKARFTFIYSYENGEWKIAHHHSSAMPEKDV